MSDCITRMTGKMENQLSKLASSLSKRKMKSSFYLSNALFSLRFAYDELPIAGCRATHRACLGSRSSKTHDIKGRAITLKPRRHTSLTKICFALAFFTAFGALAGKVSSRLLESLGRGLQPFSCDDVNGD